VVTLAVGHFALGWRRQQLAAEAEAARVQEQLALRERVGECERRREHLSSFAQLAAHVSHEVRNPLSSIALNLELLDEEFRVCECKKGPIVRQLVASMQSEAARLKDLTEEYLAFSKPRHPSRQAEDLGELAGDLARLLREEALRAGVVLSAPAPQAPVLAQVDRNQVKQALLNVVRNAVQAMPGGGRAELKAFLDGGRACVSVADTGPGIPEEDRCKIFEPFYTTKPQGTGLGLALVLHIVREHGGEMQVTAGSDGGAVFTMSFDEARVAAPAVAAVPPALVAPFEVAS
jgi:signal transduction histidine kinase